MKNKVRVLICLIVLDLIMIPIIAFLFYDKVYLEKHSKIKLELNGKEEITLNVFDKYQENGYIASFRDKNITSNVKVDNDINTAKVGKYNIEYNVIYDNKKASKKRVVNVVDKEAPIISLEGELEQNLTIGQTFLEDGYNAYDNYDGNITDKVVVESNIDSEKEGTYSIIYKVCDSSNNCNETVRTINYNKPVFKSLPDENSLARSIAVLNYHFFSDPTIGEEIGDSNYISVQNFEEQLKYLKDNNYKTLTIEEFRAWKYGEIDLPARSVLLTIDDGARGTGLHNGNKLIPLLEKYQVHATLFLITGWWDISNYQSSYLDVESHSNDLHTSSYCEGVSRGAKILCLNDDEVLNDLKTSIEITGSNTAFCFPFYAYSNHTIDLIKEAGFKLAFVGGGYKATRDVDSYQIPRYHIYSTTSLYEFNNMIA